MGEELATWQISKIRLSKQSHHWMGFLLNKFLQWLVLLCLQPAGVFLSGFSKHQQPHAYESGSVKIMSTLEHLCKLFLKIFLSLKTFLTCSQSLCWLQVWENREPQGDQRRCWWCGGGICNTQVPWQGGKNSKRKCSDTPWSKIT